MFVKGFKQSQGVDYDTFLPVAMLKSIWILLATTTYYYEIWQMDVDAPFLNRE